MTLGTVAIVGELVGFLLASYGLLRQSFVDLEAPRPFGEGRYGEGSFGGGPSATTRVALWFGKAIGLLPKGRLTVSDKQRNALYAVFGVLIGAASLILELGVAICHADH